MVPHSKTAATRLGLDILPINKKLSFNHSAGESVSRPKILV